VLNRLGTEQSPDGSYGQSPMRTAGVLNLVTDLQAQRAEPLVADAAAYLLGVLVSQPGYARASAIEPGSLRTPCDLGGFFGPYGDRGQPDSMAQGAREMNALREFDPLLGPQSEVRSVRRSSLDRAGPGSCYAWGLVPLSYVIRALCRAGYAHDARLQPALQALLGVQREGGGWCRNLGGHPHCTLYALYALCAHRDLRRSQSAERLMARIRDAKRGDTSRGNAQGLAAWWQGTSLYAALQATADLDVPVARQLVRDSLDSIIPGQRKDGTFGGPCAVERVASVLWALASLRSV
jgi:hypothetical protein